MKESTSITKGRIFNKVSEIEQTIKSNQMVGLIIRGFLMGLMLIAIFLHLLNTELTSAPEFIYNQF